MIQINTIFQKIADNNPTDEIIADINNCRNDLKQLHEEIVDDLSKEEININEYDPFFENGMVMFPEYTKNIDQAIQTSNDENLKNSLNDLCDVFVGLIKTGNEYFEKRGAFK